MPLRRSDQWHPAVRLDEPAQVDLVLGDGAHDRGALCEEISADPATGAGVGYVRLETDPDPIRVCAAFVTDGDIHAMTAAVTESRMGSSSRLPGRPHDQGLPAPPHPASGTCSAAATANPSSAHDAKTPGPSRAGL